MSQWFYVVGVALQLVGAIVLASGLFISEEGAVELAATRYVGSTPTENLQAPAARDRLKQSRNAKVGVLFIAAGAFFQIAGAWSKGGA